jgi:hypothetical protein
MPEKCLILHSVEVSSLPLFSFSFFLVEPKFSTNISLVQNAKGMELLDHLNSNHLFRNDNPCISIIIRSLFNDTDCDSHYIDSNDWTIANLTGMSVEGCGNDIIYDTIVEFAWMDCENPRKPPGWIASVPG